MKKLLIVLTLSFFAVVAKAQTQGQQVQLPSTLIMPDGSIVPTKSLDSIKKVFGGRDIGISLLADGAHVHPQKTKAEQLESDQNLSAHLNNVAPDFALTDINGKSYSMASLKGKVVVLNFWFTQCGGCVAEMPTLNALKAMYPGKDVVFIAITYNDKVTVDNFLAKTKFDYTIIPNGAKTCKDYNIWGYPTSMVIDRAGIVRYINASIDDNIKYDLAKAIDEFKNK